MPSESSSDVRFEIGHVLFVDIVGYSKLLINEQSEQIQKLNEIVRGTDQVRLADAEGKLLLLPTGDGGALVFRTNPEAPVLCALEISKALKSHPELQVRMGIHSGPVNEVTDLNEQANIAGAGINIAQRVMDCGDAGHILISKRVADDLEQYPQWHSLLHELGEIEVKHGHKIQLVNFFTDEVGNPARPTRCPVDRPSKSGPTARAHSSGAIAVLPLENLSGQPEEEFFADGMTEALITDLAKIGGLKVISRGSVMGFKGTKQPLSEIGRSLGVDSIVEGSVMRSRDRVRISARLVRAETDEYLWAERYDRELADVLSLQDEVARAVAQAIDQTLHGRAPPRRVGSIRKFIFSISAGAISGISARRVVSVPRYACLRMRPHATRLTRQPMWASPSRSTCWPITDSCRHGRFARDHWPPHNAPSNSTPTRQTHTACSHLPIGSLNSNGKQRSLNTSDRSSSTHIRRRPRTGSVPISR